MKKMILTVTSAVMALSLAACGSTQAAASSSSDASASASASAAEQHLILAISPDYPPYDDLTTDGKVTGFDVDMADWLFTWLNANGYNVSYEWKQMSFDTIVSAVQTGQVDLGVAGFTYNAERKVLFSNPYYTEYQVAMVPTDSAITSLDDLKGKKIGVQMGTNAEKLANQIENAKVTSIEDNSIVVETLKSGGVDAAIMGNAVATKYAATGDYKILDGYLEKSGNYIIAAEGNTAVMDMMNKAIDAFTASDDYKTMTTKWFSAAN